MQTGWRVIAQGCLIVCAVTGVWAQANSEDVPVERGVPILPGSGLLPGQQSVQPASPVMIEPADGAVITAPEGNAAAVQFKWQPGSPASPVTSYRVCVFEATKTCQDPASESYSVGAQAGTLSPPAGLSVAKFLGKSLKWSVEACVTLTMRSGVPQASRPGDPSPVQGGLVSIRCAASPARTLYWTLPPPQLAGLGRAPGSDPTVLHYAFYWTPVTGARAYLFCLYDGPSSSCTTTATVSTAANPLIAAVGGPEYRVLHDLPQFRGKQVRWTVAACTHVQLDQVSSSPLPDDLRCTWQAQPNGWGQVDIQNVLSPPILNHAVDLVPNPPNGVAELRMSWQLSRPQDVKSVKVCIVTERDPVSPEAAKDRLLRMSPSACEQRNLIQNAVRTSILTSCILKRPYVRTHDGASVFGFAVGECNQKNECWYSTPFAVLVDHHEPFGSNARCE